MTPAPAAPRRTWRRRRKWPTGPRNWGRRADERVSWVRCRLGPSGGTPAAGASRGEAVDARAWGWSVVRDGGWDALLGSRAVVGRGAGRPGRGGPAGDRGAVRRGSARRCDGAAEAGPGKGPRGPHPDGAFLGGPGGRRRGRTWHRNGTHVRRR